MNMRSVKMRRPNSKPKEKAPPPPPPLRGGRVTAISGQIKDPTRFSLFIDDHFVLGLSGIVAARVRVGQELSIEEVSQLAELEEFERARESALHYLEYRPRSEDEIRRHLMKKYSPTLITQVVTRLREAGLLGDKEFAKFWVGTREEFKPRSARALKYELRQKGVAPEAISRAVKHLDEHDSAYRAARAKAERFQTLEYREFQSKIGGFLARRGFGYDIVKVTVKKLYDEFHEGTKNENMDDENDD